ncbi:MAG: hypothetical protein KDC12_01835 [Flavobacteriales bacterium]|nr:hypothetical protein [Flavobacteriales bacterium]
MKRGLVIGTWVLIIAAAMVLLGFVRASNQESICWKLDIDISHQDQVLFVSETLLRQQIAEQMGTLEGTAMTSIQSEGIRQIVLNNPGVSDAIVHKTLDGRVHVEAHQRAPLCRIMNADGSGFYLDKEGWIIPLSSRYTAHVPVFLGALHESPKALCVEQLERDEQLDQTYLDEILKVANYVQENEFLSALADHFWIGKNGDFVMIPRIGDHEIVIGEVTDLNKKMKKLEAFYSKTVNKTNLNKYQTINLKFRDQVVCTRKPWQ